MARKNKSDGFSFEDIVSTDFTSNNNNNIDNDVEINDNINVNVKDNIIDKLKNNDEAKVKTLIYLDSDVSNHLDHYGELLGKKNGGKSKFSNESIKSFLQDNNLWDEKIANKKRKNK